MAKSPDLAGLSASMISDHFPPNLSTTPRTSPELASIALLTCSAKPSAALASPLSALPMSGFPSVTAVVSASLASRPSFAASGKSFSARGRSFSSSSAICLERRGVSSSRARATTLAAAFSAPLATAFSPPLNRPFRARPMGGPITGRKRIKRLRTVWNFPSLPPVT